MPTKPEAPNPPAPKDFAPRKPTPAHAPAPPRAGSAPMPSTLSALGRLPASSGRLPAPPPLPRSEAPEPAKSDPFPAEEAPTPRKHVGPFAKVEFRGPGASQTARTFRNYEALTEENKRLVDALVLALRGTVDGGR